MADLKHPQGDPRVWGDERLRGNPEGIRVLAPEEYPALAKDFGTRVDGTPKGLGFFGVLARTDEPEMISTELSTSVTVNGEKLLFPLLVPSLTAEEIAHLVDGGQPTKTIVEKALRHAEHRLATKQSPFAGEGEQIALPKSGDAEMREGFEGVETLRTGEMLGYQKRDKLFPKEEELFKANPHGGGMAADDNRVLLNPYSKLKTREQQLVATLEATRLFMREHKITPTFELTNEQRAFFKGTPYEKDDLSAKQSILSRIFVGDPSAGTLTPEQKATARDVMIQMRARGVTK